MPAGTWAAHCADTWGHSWVRLGGGTICTPGFAAPWPPPPRGVLRRPVRPWRAGWTSLRLHASLADSRKLRPHPWPERPLAEAIPRPWPGCHECSSAHVSLGAFPQICQTKYTHPARQGESASNARLTSDLSTSFGEGKPRSPAARGPPTILTQDPPPILRQEPRLESCAWKPLALRAKGPDRFRPSLRSPRRTDDGCERCCLAAPRALSSPWR